MSNLPKCSYPGCEQLSFAACQHVARCGDHLYGDTCDEACRRELGLAFVRFLRDVCAPAARLADELWLVRIPLFEDFPRIYNHFYPAYRERYDDEGAPLGPEDAGMWQWYEERYSAAVH